VQTEAKTSAVPFKFLATGAIVMNGSDDLLNNRALIAIFDIRERLARIEESNSNLKTQLAELKAQNSAQHQEQKTALNALSNTILGDGVHSHETRIQELEDDDNTAKNRLAGGLAVLSIAWPILWSKIKQYIPGF